MTIKRPILLGIGLWLGLAHGCGTSDDDSSPGSGGTAGSGHAGMAGSVASAGHSGAATAGEGGTPTNAGGEAGTRSNVGGEIGTSTNAGGEGGACLVEVAPHDLGDACGLGPFGNGEYATVTTACSFEATCKELGCGTPWSDFDAGGCRRATCTSSTDCGQSERCVPRVLYESVCNPSVYERCSVDSCEHCACSTSEDCNNAGFCFPAADYPTSGDCNVDTSDCDAVADRLSYLELDGTFTGDAAEAVNACVERLAHALNACNGTAGAAGAGGEAGRSAR